MNSPGKQSNGNGSWVRQWTRRVMTAGRTVGQGFSAMATDIAVLGRARTNGSVLRQRSTGEFKILVRTGEEVGRRIYYHGALIEPEIDFVRDTIQPNDVCFDVGANVGYYTLLMAKLAPQGRVHAFEPVPLNYHLLSASVLANGFTNVSVNQLAVSDSEGRANFVLAEDSAYSSLRNTERKGVAREFQVATTSLSQYCDRLGIHKVDFLKVDVEGAEEQVVSGARAILADPARRPRVIMLELYDPMLAKFGSSIPRMLDLMRSFRYTPSVYWRDSLVPYGPELAARFENVLFHVGNNRG
ncbi:MAG: FkbM family methyltransferase [Verrucomicrobiales bacterium]|nr:FkbM family methyltransferase [Verrucomicrobiales bacterium]